MQVKLYASLRQAAGTKMLDVDVPPGTTLGDVMLEITRQHPVLDEFIWKAQAELSQNVHIFVNGVNFHQLDGLATLLSPEDKVDIFPPLVGGQ